MKIAQITDLHLIEDKNGKINDVNTFQSASDVVNHLSKNHKPIDYLIITGDISDDGTNQSYNHLNKILSPIDTKIFLIPGNHDSIDNLDTFRASISSQNKFVIENDDWLIFMFDTKKPNSPNGQLKIREIDLFASTINEHPDKNIIVFLHHHPVMIGSASMDKMIIENSSMLLDIVNRNNRIKGVFWGHIHNVFESKINNAILLSSPSTCFQSKPNSKTFTIDKDSSPGYRIINLDSRGAISSEVIRI